MLTAVLLLACSAGCFIYAGVLALPSYSPRQGIVRRLGPQRLPSGPEGRLALMLRQVPLTRDWPPSRFRLLQAGLGAGMFALLAAPWLLFRGTVDPVALILYPGLLWALPLLWLRVQVFRRTALIERAYPDLLAHLAAQTRAGAGTLQAFATAPPVLRQPLRMEVEELIADLRVAPFPAAMERFAERCGVPAIRTFVQNLIHQQSLGIALPQVLADEEAHAIAMARQAARQRIQGSAVTMAAVTVILLINGLLIYFTPVLYDLTHMIAQQR